MHRRQAEGDVAGLQHGQPLPCRRVSDAAFAAKGRQIQQLADTSGAHAQERLKRQEVSDIEDLPDVTFELLMANCKYNYQLAEPVVICPMTRQTRRS